LARFRAEVREIEGRQETGAVSEETRGERLQIMLTGEELTALDDWRYSRRMPSRAAAVRELLRRGLAGEGYGLSDGRKSRDFTVMESPEGDGPDS
jgi:hypothetical protein